MMASMKPPVSTNWHNSLLDGPQGTCTKEVYGKLASDVIDGVRPALLLPQISRHEAGEHIRYAHQRGIRVNYPAKQYEDSGVDKIILDQNINHDCDRCGFCRRTFEKMDSFNQQGAQRRRKCFEAFIETKLNGEVFAEN
jgi:hypothetical protein